MHGGTDRPVGGAQPGETLEFGEVIRQTRMSAALNSRAVLTGLNNPTGVAVDSAGDLFVVASLSPPTVNVFGPPNGTAGNVAPMRSIAGGGTGMFFPEGLAVTRQATFCCQRRWLGDRVRAGCQWQRQPDTPLDQTVTWFPERSSPVRARSSISAPPRRRTRARRYRCSQPVMVNGAEALRTES